MLTGLDDLALFAHVVDRGGFSAAARVLGVPRSKVSRRVAGLEERLGGARLLQRDTRKIALTSLGERVLTHARVMRAEAEEAFAIAADVHAEPSGLVRITCPVALATVLMPGLLARYCLDRPRVRVQLDASNRIVDLVEEGFDLALRALSPETDLADSRLVARKIAPVTMALVVSPAVFAEPNHEAFITAGYSVHPRDLLARCQGLALAAGDGQHAWQFAGPNGRRERATFQPRFVTGDVCVLAAAAEQGLGAAVLPRYIVREALAHGRLVEPLPHWRPEPGQLYAVTPTRKGRLPAVQALLDLLLTVLPAQLGS